jgi:glycosyltransferase involved in cell wall biosynthesis
MMLDTPSLSTNAFPTEPQSSTNVAKISIVTPTLNATRYLSMCLDSVQQQLSHSVEIEHLILDGGSTDGTLEMTQGYPVTYVARPSTMGLVDAMCLGFENATGDLVGFLGADDVLMPGAMKAVAEAFHRDRHEAIFCRTRWVDAELRTLGELAPPPHWLTAKIHASLGWSYISACASFVTPNLYRRLGGFDRSYSKSLDYEFSNRILFNKLPFSRVNQSVCMYRRHEENASLLHDADCTREARMVQQKYGSKNSLMTQLSRMALQIWIYSRNPQWAYYQIARKLRSGKIRG